MLIWIGHRLRREKHRRPWFLLAALTLAHHGYRIVMHGASGHAINRVYTEQVLQILRLFYLSK